jgi:hypothetical protein
MTESRIKTYIKTRLRAPPEGLVLRWAKKSKVHRPPAENQHNIIWVYFLGGIIMFCLVLAFLKSRDLPLFFALSNSFYFFNRFFSFFTRSRVTKLSIF